MSAARRSTPARGRAPGAALLALGVALAFVAALASFIGAPATGTSAGGAPPVDALLVDTSASVTRTRPGWRRWAVRELARAARRAGDAGHEVVVVTFASEVKRRWGPGPAAEFLEVVRSGASASWLDVPTGRGAAAAAGHDLASDLAGAARTALELIAEGERPPGAVVVLGDGTATGPDPSPLLLDPRFSELQLIRPEPASVCDVAVDAVHVPRVVEPGARVPVRVELVLTGPDPRPSDRGTIVLEWELATSSAAAKVGSTTLRGSEAVRFGSEQELFSFFNPLARDEGKTGAARGMSAWFDLPPLAEGSATLRVRSQLGAALEVGARDPYPENDEGSATILVGDPVRTLVVIRADAPQTGRSYFTGAAFDGIEFQTIRTPALARALESDTPPDAIITLDVPLAGLPASELAQFVEGGGGWVHCNGWTLLRSDAPELAGLVALKPDREPREPHDIVIFVDGSGSMRGERWERVRAALGELVPSIAARDRLELRFFTQVMGEPLLVFEAPSGSQVRPEESAARQAAVRALMSARVPGGATDIVGSLLELADVRVAASLEPGASDRNGLCILITDGLTDSVASLRRKVREQLTAAGDRVVAIQVGDDRLGTRFLEGLLIEGESVVHAGELEDLLDILQETMQDVRLVEGARVLESLDPGGDPWAVETRRAVVDAADLASPLVLPRALRCRPADGATALLDFGPGAGAFATIVGRGHGTVCGVAVPFLGRGREAWSPELRRRRAWLAPILRTMGRRRDAAPAQDAIARPTVSLEDGGRRLVVRGLPEGMAATLRADISLAPKADPFGTLVPGDVIASVAFETPVIDVAPARVRVAERPGILDQIPRGETLEVTLQSGTARAIGPFPLQTDGPSELASISSARSSVVRAFSLAGRTEPVAGSPSSAGDFRAPQPLTPLLISAALLALFLGALGAVFRGGLGRPWRR